MAGDRVGIFDNIEGSNTESNVSASDFSVVRKKPLTPEELAVVNETADKNKFTSTKAQPPAEPVRQQRRHRTGRNQQLNIKATDQTVQKFYRLTDEAGITLGELLERALTALEAANKKIEIEK